MERFINRPRVLWTSLGAVAVFGAIGGAWILSLPPPPAAPTAPPLAEGEAEAILNALKPPKRQRPAIAIVGINDATETTDYLMPYGVLRRANVADVVLLATRPGPVRLYPALTVEPRATVQDFDARHPDGADYVIVPAMSRDDDPGALEWITAQAAKGATIIGVCAGAKVVAAAGLLDDKRATTHWYFVDELRDKHPGVQYVANRRLVVDRGVATTTGITASMPMALTLIEAIAGREKAEAVAEELGLTHWDARHDSAAFTFTRPFALTAIRNTVAFWRREQLGLEIMPGIDEVSLALVADAWSRTYRSRAITFSRVDGAQETRNGVRVRPDKVVPSWPPEHLLPSIAGRKPAIALDDALRRITARYGTRTADFVATQLEYPRVARVLSTSSGR
jgi:putative intracellular protease/amidase